MKRRAIFAYAANCVSEKQTRGRMEAGFPMSSRCQLEFWEMARRGEARPA